jgi:hypothetical protein
MRWRYHRNMHRVSPSIITAAADRRSRAAVRAAAGAAARIDAARAVMDGEDVPKHCAAFVSDEIDLDRYGEAPDVDAEAEAWARTLPDLNDSREALDAVRTLRTADAAALPLLRPTHAIEAHTANTTASLVAARIRALTHARIRAAHVSLMQKVALTQRAAAATSGSAWAQVASD